MTRKATAEHARKVYTVGDLRDVPRGTFQYCETCGGEWSATHGDYFMAADDQPLMCCEEPVRLVTKATRYSDID